MTTFDKKKYHKKYLSDYRANTKRTELTLSIVEYNKFKKIADKEKLKVPAVIRNMAIAFRDTQYQPKNRPSSELLSKLDELKAEINMIGININQVSHRSHVLSHLDSTDENIILNELKRLKDLIEAFSLTEESKRS